MEIELFTLDEQMKKEIQECKDKYNLLKKQTKDKYRLIEKEKKKKEKEELKNIRKSIPKTLRNKVWDTVVGKEKGIGNCFVCNINIDSKNFECGHIISVKEGGETNLENLKPICGCCNKSMGTQNLIEFKFKYFPEEKELNITDIKVIEFIKNNITNSDGYNSFIPLDDIYANYLKWLSIEYEEYYSSINFNINFKHEILNVLKKELLVNYHDNTNEYEIQKYYSIEPIDNYYDKRLKNILNEYVNTKEFQSNNAKLCFKKQLKRMIIEGKTNTPKFEAFDMWRISRIHYYISTKNSNYDDNGKFIMNKGYGFMNIKLI